MNSGANFKLEDIKLEDINMKELLPQQEPFVMVDKLVHYDTVVTATRFTVREDNIFVDGGVLDSCALAENIAQTCSARLGYINKYILHRDIQLGFIGLIRRMEVKRCPVVGDVLDTQIQVIEEVGDMTLMNAHVKRGVETIAVAQMAIAAK